MKSLHSKLTSAREGVGKSGRRHVKAQYPLSGANYRLQEVITEIEMKARQISEVADALTGLTDPDVEFDRDDVLRLAGRLRDIAAEMSE